MALAELDHVTFAILRGDEIVTVEITQRFADGSSRTDERGYRIERGGESDSYQIQRRLEALYGEIVCEEATS